jgi:hypothetical protein
MGDFMRIDKEKSVRVAFEKNLWEELSPEEIRLYLLFIVRADERKGEGKLNGEEIEKYLGINIQKEKLKKVSSTLEKLHLAKIEYVPGKSEVKFKLLKI